jgi:hypothetical protein
MNTIKNTNINKKKKKIDELLIDNLLNLLYRDQELSFPKNKRDILHIFYTILNVENSNKEQDSSIYSFLKKVFFPFITLSILKIENIRKLIMLTIDGININTIRELIDYINKTGEIPMFLLLWWMINPIFRKIISGLKTKLETNKNIIHYSNWNSLKNRESFINQINIGNNYNISKNIGSNIEEQWKKYIYYLFYDQYAGENGNNAFEMEYEELRECFQYIISKKFDQFIHCKINNQKVNNQKVNNQKINNSKKKDLFMVLFESFFFEMKKMNTPCNQFRNKNQNACFKEYRKYYIFMFLLSTKRYYTNKNIRNKWFITFRANFYYLMLQLYKKWYNHEISVNPMMSESEGLNTIVKDDKISNSEIQRYKNKSFF